MKFNIFLFVTILAVLVGCDDKKNSNLPKANGKPGEILLIVDSMQWKGVLGSELKKVFRTEVPGLPQDEPMFTIIWVHPQKNLKLLTSLRNIVYVFTLDQKTRGSKILIKALSPETLKRIQQDTSFYLSTVKDEYARGQEVMYLFGNTQEELMHHLRKNKKQIINFFNKTERERLAHSLFNSKSSQGIAATLRNEQKIDIKVPAGYLLADKQSDFIWLRQIDANKDRDIFISWKPYENETQLSSDSIIAWRDAIAKRYLFEDPKNPISYLVTEKADADVQVQQINFNNRFAMEIRGLWRTNNRTMGGPFLAYVLPDQSQGRLYYIEGFAFAPGKEKREYVRELETILWSFRTSEDLKK